MNIFEELDKKFNIRQDAYNLSRLMIEKSFIYNYSQTGFSFRDYFDNFYFRKWKFSYGFVDLTEYEASIGIKDMKNQGFCPEDENQAFNFLQYAYNVVTHTKNEILKKDRFSTIGADFFLIFKQKFDYILSKIGQKVIKDSKEDYYIIVPCNDKTKRCAELQTDVDVSFALYDYSSPLHKGNINEKKKILTSLSTMFEPKIKFLKKQSGSDISNVADDLSFMLNNFDIRHDNNSPDISKNQNRSLKSLGQNELEKVYDTCYDLMLDVILLENYVKNVKNYCKNLKSKCKKGENDDKQ